MICVMRLRVFSGDLQGFFCCEMQFANPANPNRLVACWNSPCLKYPVKQWFANEAILRRAAEVELKRKAYYDKEHRNCIGRAVHHRRFARLCRARIDGDAPQCRAQPDPPGIRSL